mmetsp:Transcript_20842/g.31447  ORF Transcript_20842/g.31447 Transcript_20842/m.31447 type:complete len:130 (-) Transcript_20842:157-546(-)
MGYVEGNNDEYEDGTENESAFNGDGAEEYDHHVYLSSPDAFPDVEYEEAHGGGMGYSGSFDPDPQARAESSPRGSPVERIFAAAQSAAQSAVSNMLGGRDLLPQDLNEVFGRGRGGGRVRKPTTHFSPS